MREAPVPVFAARAANALSRVQQLIQVIDLAGCAPLVRVPANDPTSIKQVLDAGAHGIIVPMISTPQDAQAAVAAVRYPPEGTRGVGLWRAQGYGRSFREYLEWQKTGCRVLVQIEHIRGVENLSGILGVDGVDGFIVGPYDLSASLGAPGLFDRPDVREALAEIDRAIRQTDKLVGYHIVYPDRELFMELLQKGYNLIAYGTDFTFLTTAVDDEMAFVRGQLYPDRKPD